ncbi:MAG: Gfo/Idh/MocA family oxidoreductase [Candidatus Colwellbacteria bacterium]|nr:Gfo/Idh/MocA family oxidoreductase [Candidatus Colwellbacteria bacterium]
MKNKLKIAIVGFGKRGKTHFRNYQSFPHVEIAAVCDSNEELLRGVGVPICSDYKRTINDYDIDGVSICVPTKFHYDIARYCLMKDKHVLVEKPVTINVKEAKVLQELSVKRGVVCMAGYSLRFDRNIEKIKDILENGEIGNVIAVRGRQAHNWGGKQPFDWHINKKISGGGTIIDNGSHYFDLLDDLFGPIVEINAVASNGGLHSPVEDTSIISLRFANGLIGSIETSWADARGRNNELIIWGKKAVIEYSESNRGGDLNIVSYGSNKDEWNRLTEETLYIPRGIEQIIKQSNIDNNKALLAESTANMLGYFLTLISDGSARTKFLDKHDLVRSVVLVDLAYKSLGQHRSVKTV